MGLVLGLVLALTSSPLILNNIIIGKYGVYIMIYCMLLL